MKTVNRFAALAVVAAASLLAIAQPTHAQQPGPGGPPPGMGGPPPGMGAKMPHPIVTLVTSKGTILIKLFPEEAPNTCDNFIKLINKKFYDGLTFHRVEPGFVVQGGDPKGNGQGGPGYEIKNEPNRLMKHNRGAVAMANAGRDTAGSQFYIVIAHPAPHLDNGNYTIFGQVIAGQDVAEKIQVGDKMTKVTVKTQ